MPSHFPSLPDPTLSQVSTRIIELCLKELFEFRTMQTDPNWTNFLWNAQTRQVRVLLYYPKKESFIVFN